MADDVAPGDPELRALLAGARTIAIVGLSPKPDRPSHEVAAYLQERGVRVIPVNPAVDVVLGEQAYPSLLAIPEEITVDIVDVFRRAEEAPAIARDAVRIGARALWLQDEIVSEEAARIAGEAGLDVIMGMCIMRTSRRVLKGDRR